MFYYQIYRYILHSEWIEFSLIACRVLTIPFVTVIELHNNVKNFVHISNIL